MQPSKLAEDLSVCGQISPADIARFKDAGVTTIICNRPDNEGAGQPCADEIRAAAEAAGMEFHYNPIAPGEMTPEAVRKQGEAIKGAEGPVLAYCGSGKRATALWMLSNPHDLDAEERVDRAAKAGHDLAALRPKL